jgi:hypothetical protein
MSIKHTIGALILAETVSILAQACSHTARTEAHTSRRINHDHLANIEMILNNKTGNKSYGGNLRHDEDMHEDGMHVGKHTLGTMMYQTTNGILTYLFIDDMILRDKRGHGVDQATLMECTYRPESKYMNTGCGISLTIDLDDATRSEAANALEQAALDAVMQKYSTGNIDHMTVKTLDSALGNFLSVAYSRKTTEQKK